MRNHLFTIYIFFICLSWPDRSAKAQTTISGIIINDFGETVIGANVLIQDSYDGTSTDLEGKYSFTTTETGTKNLVVTYLGFKDHITEIELNGATLNLDIKLKPSAGLLKEVIITAGAFEASDEKKGVVLSSLDIVTTAGASADIAGALNTLPGTQRVGETGQLFVRGGAAYETKTFIDGMRVQNPYNSTVPDIPSRNRFSPFLFKGTLFSTGGYSAEYGQALSSALILNSIDIAPESTTGVSLMSIGGGLSHTHATENTSIAVSANYMNLGPYINLVPQNRDWDDPVQGLSGQLIFRHKTTETGIFKLHTDVNRNWMKFSYADYENAGKQVGLSLENKNIYINSTYSDLLNEKWSYRVGASYADNRDDIEQTFALNTVEKTMQGKVALTNFTNDKVTVKFGAELIENQYDENYSDNVSEYISDLDESYLASFVESDIYFNRKLAMKVGLRFERSKLLDAYNVAPRISLAYKTGKGAQVSIAYGKFYQTPENEFLRFDTGLDFESADHYIINYQKIINKRVFRIEGYYKTYDGLVKFNSERPWELDNQGDGYARGVDLFFRDRKSIKFGDYWISYSYLDTEREYRDFPSPAAPFFASAHNGSVVYKHWVPKITTSFGLTYSAASGRPYNDPNIDAFQSERTRPYQDLSFSASYLTNVMRNFTIFYVSISNIPGFKQSFGFRYAANPDTNGDFPSFEVTPDATRFFFVGVFMNIGQKFEAREQDGPE